MKINWFRKAGKRFLALMLCFALLFSSVSVSADDVANKSSETIDDAVLKAALEEDTENYPDGGFEFFLSQLEGTEGDATMELLIVRRGGNDAEATVDFKAVGVSAAYGEDYTLSVKESAFTKRVLEPEVDAVTLTETYGQDAFQADLSEEISEEESEEESAEISAGEPEEESEEEPEEESEEEPEEKSAEEPDGEIVPIQVSASKKSSLQLAKDTYLNEDSDYLSWTEIDDATKKEAEEQFDQMKDSLEDFAQDIPGAAYTFTFAPGEYKKTVYIDIIDDNISETDEQVMFLLSNAQNGELAGTTTAYLNIKDNDENEQVVFAMADSEVVVNREDGVAKITVKRVSGTAKMASVVVGTGGDTAKPDVDYEPMKKEIVFMQGVTEQVVEIPLLDGTASTEELSFKVALDTESAYVQEGCEETTVRISGSGETVIEEIEDGSRNAGSDWTQTLNVSVSASVAGKKNASSGKINILTGVDLSTADYVTIQWKSTTYVFYNFARKNYIYINGIQAYTDSLFQSKSTTITLTEAMKVMNATLALEVRTMGTSISAKTEVSQVIIHYPGYTFTVTNTPYIDTSTGYSNQYTEKIYTESGDKVDSDGHRYKEGTTWTIGTIQLAKNGSSTYSDSITLHRSGIDTVTVKNTYSTNPSTNGTKINAGYNGNVYLVGYQLQLRGSSNTWSEIIPPDNLVFSKSFLTTYSKYLLNGNEFRIRPVYRPYTADVAFMNTDSTKGSYNNKFSDNSVLRCTQLDTIELKGIANAGYAVDGFSLGAYADGTLHNKKNSLNKLAEQGTAYYKQTKKTIAANSSKYSVNRYTKVAVSNAVWSKVLANVITFTPDKEYVYLNMTYNTPQISVKIDPLNNNKDKGEVVYTPKDGETVDEDSVLKGNMNTPLVISGVTLNQEYTFNAVTEDGFKAYWKNFTGDENEDGRLTTAEEKVVQQYSFVRTANNGNAYTFRPVVPQSLIYYGFKPAEENRYAGYIDGVVALKTKPIFGGTEKIVPVNGATVSAAGLTGTTYTDEKYGGVNENGGDGYFSLSSRDFTAGENVTVNISYNNIGISATQAVNAAAIYYIDAYDTIQVDSASAYLVEDDTVTGINASAIENGDKIYRIAINTSSTNDAISARKAVFRFYRSDGSHIDGADQTVSSENASFTLDFIPATLNIPAGATMTVQFYDQNDIAYYEHEMGFSFGKALGILSFLSSFNFGGAETAIEFVGNISGAFNFGWDGDLDKYSDYVTASEDGATKTISIGYTFNYEKDDDDDDDKKEKVKEAAKNAGNSAAQKENQKNAADDAVDSNGKDNKSSTNVGVSASVSASFALGITMCKSEQEGHIGEWYFKEMMLCVKAEAGSEVKVTYTTPIGIPVIVALSTGVSGAATFLIEQNYDKEEYYFSDIQDVDAAKIDLFSFNMNNGDRAFDAYGIFNISPYIDLSAGAGFDFLNLMIGGRADFDMNFYTDSGVKNTGDVTLSAYVQLKILFFTKKWEIASKTYSLFGSDTSTSSLKADAFDSQSGMLTLSGDEDYRYESLASMEVSDRSYLENRSAWNGGTTVAEKLLFDAGDTESTVSANGLEEMLLQENVNPNPGTQLMALGNGEYLAVFLDDDADRNDYNSKALYYTICDSAGVWSEPKLVEDDGTMDEAPAMFDLGDKIYLAWSTSSKVFEEEPGVLESLASMDIHGRFFDKATQTFGEIDKITQTAPYTYEDNGATISDNVADVDPHVSYDEETGRMLVFYTKSEYTSSVEGDEDGVYGDAANPYSVIAYRVYDTISGTWETSYTEEEGVSEDYTKAWYGQRFLDLAPRSVMVETLDEEGYWTEDPTFQEYQNVTYTDENGAEVPVDPIVIESDAITYDGSALFTYVMDYDGNKETEYDRDIFLQIYNYSENSFTHPIWVTNDSYGESNIRLVHGCNATLLAYLSNGTLKVFDIAQAVRERLLKTEVNGQEIYYIDRSRSEVDSDDERQAYSPVMTIAGREVTEAEESDEELKQDDGAIASFDFVAADEYIYAVWTQNRSVVKEGIDETSEDAQDANNRLAEAQIYAVRFENAIVTEPVQITDEAGANYDQISFAVNEDGSIKALAAKAGSIVESVTSEDGTVVSYPAADSANKDLVSIDFTPKASLAVKEVSTIELTAGTDSAVNIELYNNGLETLSDLTFTAKDEAGEIIYEELIGAAKEDAETEEAADADAGAEEAADTAADADAEAEEAADADVETEANTNIYGGRVVYIGFPITLDEEEIGCKFTWQVTDADGNVLLEDVYEEEIPLTLDVTEFSAELTDRNTIRFSAGVTNNSRRVSGEQTLTIQKVGTTNKDLLAIKVDSMSPGGYAYFEEEYSFNTYKDMFTTYIDENTENYEAVTEFIAKTGIGESVTTNITLTATKEQRLRLQSITEIDVVDEEHGLELEVGDITQVQTAVETVPYSGSRYEGMDDEDNVNNTSGLRVMYKTEDTDIVQIYDSGYMEGLKAGTATVTAYILPENNHYTYNSVDGTIAEDNFLTLPNEAILTEEFKVTVTGEEESTPSTEPSTESTPSTEPSADNTITVTGISLNKTKASIGVKKSVQLSATIAPANATNQTVTWSSSDETVAKVVNGKVTGLKAGTAVITATTANQLTATCNITVTSVSFGQSSVSIGLKEAYKITPVLSNGTTDKLSKITVASSNKKVATVKKLSKGKVQITGKKKGTAKITVTTTSGATATLKVTVKAAPKTITAKKAKYTVKKGKTAQIKYTLSKNSASGTVTFTSANKKIATVSETGKITGKKKGTTKITLKTYNGKKATVTVVVK